MHDPNIPSSDDSLPGDAPEPPGALLFDPSAPIPLDEMDAYGVAEEERPSRLPQIVFGMLAVAVIGLGAFYVSAGGEAGGEQPLPDAPTLPTAGIRPGEIIPDPPSRPGRPGRNSDPCQRSRAGARRRRNAGHDGAV